MLYSTFKIYKNPDKKPDLTMNFKIVIKKPPNKKF